MDSIQGRQLYRLETVDKCIEIMFKQIINRQIQDHCIDLIMEIMYRLPILNLIEFKMEELFQLLKAIDKLRESMEPNKRRILLQSLTLISL